MKSKTYKIDLPTYAITYLEYADCSGLTQNDIDIIDRFVQQFHDEAEKLNGHVVFDFVGEESSFTPYPEFGLACDTISTNVNILYP